MTYRATVNYYPGAVNVEYYLYRAYTFLTTASPSGAGWTSVGEGNGSSGGMGTTGIITSASSLAGNNRWFVLQAPGSPQRQILMYRPSFGSCGFRFTDHASGFTGGGASTLPTATYALWPGDVSSIQNSVMHLVADDAYPHGVWWLSMNPTSGLNVNNFMSLIPVTVQTGDTSPYVMYSNAGTTSLEYQYIGTRTGNGRGILPGANGATYVCGHSYGAGSTIYYPRNGATAVGSKPYALPIFWGSARSQNAATAKGFSSMMRWNSCNLPTKTRLGASGEYIVVSDVILPWPAGVDMY